MEEILSFSYTKESAMIANAYVIGYQFNNVM